VSRRGGSSPVAGGRRAKAEARHQASRGGEQGRKLVVGSRRVRRDGGSSPASRRGGSSPVAGGRRAEAEARHQAEMRREEVRASGRRGVGAGWASGR